MLTVLTGRHALLFGGVTIQRTSRQTRGVQSVRERRLPAASQAQRRARASSISTTNACTRGPTAQPADIKADFERKQREAMEKLEQKGDVAAPVVAPAPLPAEIQREEEPSKPEKQSREDRLAELRRKSEALKKAAPAAQQPSLEPEVAPLESDTELLDGEMAQEGDLGKDDDAVTIKAKNKRVKNVFKEIETTVESKHDKRRGRRRMDKKGGGRQKQQKKLNRQKYLEYKYVAKDILDHPQVPEEHRSNVLGQIWAKGERQGVDDSLEFIEQKEAELILPQEVGDLLRDLVKELTTRR